jgi:uncharacterized membrane protein YkvA (DUF1232 family)
MTLRTSTLLRMEMLPVVRRLPAYTRLIYALLREPALQARHKVLLLGGVAYLLSPFDLIPGFIPVVGQLDDLAVTLWTLRQVLRAAPPEVSERHLGNCGLDWAVLDDDLQRIARSGGLIARGAYEVGRHVARTTSRTLWQLGAALIQRVADGRGRWRRKS